MNAKTHPAFARRLRLSTGGIFAALILTCAALLAVAAAVGPSPESADAVPVVGPVSASPAAMDAQDARTIHFIAGRDSALIRR